MTSLKNWSLRKKARPSRSEENKITPLKKPTEPPAHTSGVPRANSLQGKQKAMPLRATETELCRQLVQASKALGAAHAAQAQATEGLGAAHTTQEEATEGLSV